MECVQLPESLFTETGTGPASLLLPRPDWIGLEVEITNDTMSESSPPPTSRRSTPTPVETTVKRVRRFAVEPVETTTRSNKKEDKEKENDGGVSNGVDKMDFAPAAALPKRRFVPEPVETTFKTNRQPVKPLPTPEPTPVSIPPQDTPQEATPKPRRKFVPELIETTKRSKKAGDSKPATLHTDKVSATVAPVVLQYADEYFHRPT